MSFEWCKETVHIVTEQERLNPFPIGTKPDSHPPWDGDNGKDQHACRQLNVSESSPGQFAPNVEQSKEDRRCKGYSRGTLRHKREAHRKITQNKKTGEVGCKG